MTDFQQTEAKKSKLMILWSLTYNQYLVFVGDGAAGGSSIIYRFLNGSMLNEYAVTILEEYEHVVEIGSKKIIMR